MDRNRNAPGKRAGGVSVYHISENKKKVLWPSLFLDDHTEAGSVTCFIYEHDHVDSGYYSI